MSRRAVRVLLTIGIFVGLIHVLLPGHGKAVVASYVVVTHARFFEAVRLALMIPGDN